VYKFYDPSDLIPPMIDEFLTNPFIRVTDFIRAKAKLIAMSSEVLAQVRLSHKRILESGQSKPLTPELWEAVK
jgi:hypothetical protein